MSALIIPFWHIAKYRHKIISFSRSKRYFAEIAYLSPRKRSKILVVLSHPHLRLNRFRVFFLKSNMPKKMGVNSKAEEARARKNNAESEKKEREARQKEDQYWKEAEGAKSKAAKKKEEESVKRAEAAAKKAEIRRLQEQEEKELEKLGKKVDKKANRVSIPVPKVTEVELARQREEENKRIEARAEELKKRDARMSGEEEYEKIVLVENTNRDDSLLEAHSVEEALAQMTINSLPPDRHPERRLKASYKAFEETELQRLKEEKSGLSHNQYKYMIWKLWKKSPDNPLNQETR